MNILPSNTPLASPPRTPPSPGPSPSSPARTAPSPPGHAPAAPAPSGSGGQSIDFEEPKTVTITRTYDEPVYHSEQLGSIPNDYYEWAPWGWSTWTRYEHHGCYGDRCEMGPVGVYRDVPDYEADGKPRKQSVTRTLSETTYNQKNRFFGFGAAGAVAGAAAGVGLLAGLGGLTPAAGLVSGLTGAAAGGALGSWLGYKSAAGDTIQEVWKTDDILHPRMDGYTETIRPDIWYEQRCHTEHDSNGNSHQVCESIPRVRGYWHDYSPDVSHRAVGSYDYPTLQHTNKIGTVGGSALAVLGGAGLGCLAAAAVRFLPALL